MTSQTLLRWTYLEGLFFALMVASSESYALLHFTRQGLGPLQVAMMSTLPLLVSALTQYIIPRLLSEKLIAPGLLASFVVQILGLILMIDSAREFTSFTELLIGLSLYWVGGQTAAPLWLDWVSRLTGPSQQFASYLARRNAITTFLIMIFYFGFSLNIDTLDGISFETLFQIGLVARIISFLLQGWLAYRAGQLPAVLPLNTDTQAFIPDFPTGDWLRFLYFFFFWTALFRFCVNLSAPFFLPYMVNELNFSTVHYALLTSLPLLSRALFLNNWGHASADLKSFWGIQLSCLFISLSPALWTLSTSVYYLSVLEFAGGIFWGGFELTAILMVQQVAGKNTRGLLGLHMAAMTVLSVLGAMVGGALLKHGLSYHQLFWLSSACRLACGVGFIVHALKMPSFSLKKGQTLPYLSTVLSLRPSMANVGRVILGRRRDSKEEAGPGFTS